MLLVRPSMAKKPRRRPRFPIIVYTNSTGLAKRILKGLPSQGASDGEASMLNIALSMTSLIAVGLLFCRAFERTLKP